MAISIEYVCHATLLIRADGISIATDPWLEESAYCDQWHLFPKPFDESAQRVKSADIVLLSHGHEDHLHVPTLEKINKNAKIIFPFTWYDDSAHFFQYLGFKNSQELKTGTV